MQLVLLGTSGYHPSETRHTPCLMIPQAGIVLDAGTAMFRVRERIVTGELDVFLTHAHLDHCIGLTYLFDVLHERDVRRVTVHGEAAKLNAIEEHLLSPLLFPVKLPCEFRELTPSVELAGGGKLTHCPLGHPGGALAFRLDWPRNSLAYVTDTVADAAADYVPWLRGVDLLIHECNFTDDLRQRALLTGHSHVTPVAEVARAAGVRRMVLVHHNPLVTAVDPVGLPLARSIFPATDVGYDGMELEF